MGKDLTGMTFGRLLVLEENGRNKQGYKLWKCKCECGEYKTVRTSDLTSGVTRSCGCLRKESYQKNLTENKTIHGDSKKGNITRLYRIWCEMKGRCDNTKSSSYKDYGGRGIRYCDDWKEYINFKKWALGNGYKDDLSLDRIDVNGNYEPNNCRWADWITQANNRRDNTLIEIDGITKTMSEWSHLYNIDTATLSYRYHKMKLTGKDLLCNGRFEKRIIYKLDLDGNLLKTYYSTKELNNDGFERKHVMRCCRGERGSYKGYKWNMYNKIR